MNTIVKKTLKAVSFAAVAAILSIGNTYAQGEKEITDEQITTYIIVMDSVNELSTQLSEDISVMIKENELLDGGRAYNIIQTAKGDSVKLAEEGITEDQLAAYNEIQEELKTRKEELNNNFSTMVKEKLGGTDYNRINKGIKNDPDIKERYEAIVAELDELEKKEGEADSAEAVN